MNTAGRPQQGQEQRKHQCDSHDGQPTIEWQIPSPLQIAAKAFTIWITLNCWLFPSMKDSLRKEDASLGVHLKGDKVWKTGRKDERVITSFHYRKGPTLFPHRYTTHLILSAIRERGCDNSRRVGGASFVRREGYILSHYPG